MKILILAGGEGHRLHPLTDPPKQFRSFGSSHSLLQETLFRFLKRYPPHDLFVITGKKHASIAQAQCEAVHPALTKQILIEPAPKNTAPAIAYAIEALHGELGGRFLVAPSDHFLPAEETFLNRLAHAEVHTPDQAHELFGVTPKFPHTGYGYIMSDSVGKVSSFHEKPPLQIAEKLIEQGALWNTGMILFHTETLLTQLPKEVPSISIDYLLLEKASNLFVTKLDLQWSDLGSFEGIYAAYSKDGQGNVVLGNVEIKNVRNSLVIGGEELRFLCDCEDCVVIFLEGGKQVIMPLGTEIPSLV